MVWQELEKVKDRSDSSPASKILLGAFFQFYISLEFVEVLVLSN